MDPTPYHEPDGLEKRFYYHGLPSRPALVARTSTTPFRSSYYMPGKELQPVGQHRIADLWNDENGSLMEKVIHALRPLSWSSIDILRAGCRDEEQPVVLFVTVDPGSTTWEKGIYAAMDCDRILREHGIDDIRCEIKEGVLLPTVSSLPPAHPGIESASSPTPTAQKLLSDDRLNDYALSDRLGMSIASFDEPYIEGTKGVYVRDGQRTFALTCRHVVFGAEKAMSSGDYRHEDGRWESSEKLMIQPGQGRMDDMIHDVAGFMMDCDLDRLLINTDPDLERRARELKVKEDELKGHKDHWESLRKRKDARSRIFGHVAFAPAVEARQQKWLADWALIELRQDGHEAQLASLSNKIFIGASEHSRYWTIRESIKIRHEGEYRGILAGYGDFVQLQNGIIPETEIFSPEDEDRYGNTSIFVCKQGGASRFTMGLANGVKSVTRRLGPDAETSFISEEWCIVGTREMEPPKSTKAFSYKGDSGSCVWDLKGRIGGLITSGNGSGHHDGQLDVTYVTPMERLMKDVRERGFNISLV